MLEGLERRQPQKYHDWQHRRDVWAEFKEELKFMRVLLKRLEKEKIKEKHEIESSEKGEDDGGD